MYVFDNLRFDKVNCNKGIKELSYFSISLPGLDRLTLPGNLTIVFCHIVLNIKEKNSLSVFSWLGSFLQSFFAPFLKEKQFSTVRLGRKLPKQSVIPESLTCHSIQDFNDICQKFRTQASTPKHQEVSARKFFGTVRQKGWPKVTIPTLRIVFRCQKV